MIDIHSHILWGVDDGARSREDSIAMLRLATETGTTDIVATPHCNSQYQFDPAARDERIRELTGATGGAPRIHSGCDFRLSYDNIQVALREPAVLHEADERFKALEVVGINGSAAAGFVAVGGVLRQAGDPVGDEVALVIAAGVQMLFSVHRPQ